MDFGFEGQVSAVEGVEAPLNQNMRKAEARVSGRRSRMWIELFWVGLVCGTSKRSKQQGATILLLMDRTMFWSLVMLRSRDLGGSG